MAADLSKAIALHREGRLKEAAPIYRAALKRAPRDPRLLYLGGLCALEMGDLSAGARHMRALLKIEPRNAAAHHALGKALAMTGRPGPGRRHLEAALEHDPAHIDARIELAELAVADGDLDRAELLLREALDRQPENPALWNNLGRVCRARSRIEDARQAWQRAAEIAPGLAAPRVNLALLAAREGRMDDAIAELEAALSQTGEDAELLAQLGALQFFAQDYEAAARALEAATRLRPGFRRAEVRLAQTLQFLCDWDGLDALMPAVDAEIARALAGERCEVSPFFALCLPIPEETRTAVAGALAREHERAVAGLRAEAGFTYGPKSKERLHLGYLSSDWRDHPAAHLSCGLFRHHDRGRFKTTVFSFGADDGSDYLRRIKEGADDFVDLAALDDLSAAKIINDAGVDILMDVQGAMGAARPDILALRPAPIQVSFLTYLGSMGAPWLDYMIVDRVMVPPRLRSGYTEALVYMPHCYQVNDDEARIGPAPPRADEGLPEDAPVYCAIHGGNKITRGIFARWMRILDRVPGAVLWLSGGGVRRDNLRRAAHAHGIDEARLVFARHVPDKADHIARLALADLYLDTPDYGAHSSAVDSLWAGTPVLTRPGEVFSARGAATLLATLGLEELIVDSYEAYEDTAVALGLDPDARAALRARLAAARASSPLFDTARWVRDAERAYERIWDLHLRGEAPGDILLD